MSGEGFIGRRQLVREMVRELSSQRKIGFSITGVRRVGKTSLLKEVERRLSAKGVPTIYISVWSVLPSTVDEFVKELNRATLSAFHDRLPISFRLEELLAAGTRALRRLLEGLKLSLKVSDDLELCVGYIKREGPSALEGLKGSLSLVEDLAKMVKSPCALIIDEFPSLLDLTYGSKHQRLGEGIMKLLKTLYEDFTFTKLVVSGSYPSVVRDLVVSGRGPFYGQLLLRELGPFTRREFEEFLQHYLPQVRFDEGAREELYKLSGGIPYNLHLLGREIEFRQLKELSAPLVRSLASGLLMEGGSLYFRELMEALQPSEVKVLKALALKPDGGPKEIGEMAFLPGDTVHSSLNLLVKKGIIKRLGRGRYSFVDGLFAEWIRGLA